MTKIEELARLLAASLKLAYKLVGFEKLMFLKTFPLCLTSGGLRFLIDESQLILEYSGKEFMIDVGRLLNVKRNKYFISPETLFSYFELYFEHYHQLDIRSVSDFPSEFQQDIDQLVELLNAEFSKSSTKLARIRSRAWHPRIVEKIKAEVWLDMIVEGKSDFPLTAKELLTTLHAQLAHEIAVALEFATAYKETIRVFNLKIADHLVLISFNSEEIDFHYRDYDYQARIYPFQQKWIISLIDFSSPKIAWRLIRELRQARANLRAKYGHSF